MTDGPDRPEQTTAAEERLLALLEPVRAEVPRSEESLIEAVMRTARWQYALRGAIWLLNDLAEALLAGVLLAFGAARPDSTDGERR